MPKKRSMETPEVPLKESVPVCARILWRSKEGAEGVMPGSFRIERVQKICGDMNLLSEIRDGTVYRVEDEL